MLMKSFVKIFSVIIIAYFLPGVFIANPWAALWTAFILGAVNIIVKPILVLLTLPISFITLGLFLFVINALMIMLTASIVQGFYVDDFISALFFSLFLSLLSSTLNKFIADKAI